ncbi:MAG: 3'-5' exonuclease [Filifactoraceae bacterium]
MERLNSEQTFVVDCLDKNILLVAPAGTGKTNTLGVRIENIIEKGKAEPSEIICLTFTNKAAKEMEERVEKALGIEGKGVVVRTIHSFCLDIIKEQIDYCNNLSSGFSILDEDDVKELLLDIFAEKYKKNLSPMYLAKIAMVLEMMSKCDVYSENNYSKAHMLFDNEDYKIRNEICLDDKYNYYHNFYLFLRDNLPELANYYEEYKARENVVDFTDLIIYVYRLLLNKDILNYYRKRFKFIHIDEMQDVSYFEYSLIEQLFCGNKILMCGDPCQAIYEWRGSRPKEILKLYEDKYTPIAINFSKNYRSTKVILEAANGFLRSALNKENLTEEFNDSQGILDWGDKIVISNHGDSFREARWIMEEIKRLDLQSTSRVAILCRGNVQNNRISQEVGKLMMADRYYQNKKVNFFLAEEFKLFRRKEIKLAINFLRLYRNSRDEKALKRILKTVDYRVGAKVLDKLMSDEVRALGIGITDLIHKDSMVMGDYYGFLEEGFKNESIVIFDVESTGIDVFFDDIIQVAAIKMDRKGNEIDRFERFLVPRKSVGASVEVHGFSDSFLATKGEAPEVVLKDFLKFTKGTVIVGHNVFFDLSIMRVNLSRLGLENLDIKFYYDTLEIARRFLDLKSYRLGDLVKFLNLKNIPDHNAMNDILATGELLVHLMDNYIDIRKAERKAIYMEYYPNFRYIAYTYSILVDSGLRGKSLLEKIYDVGNFREIFKKDDTRLKNLESFIQIVDNLDDRNYDANSAIGKILEYTTLSNSQMDIMAVKEEKIPIITVHQAKGLEYDYIFLASVNENVFPSYRSVKDNKLLEEMKLFYVAMTRAKKKLYISSSGRVSSFIDMIPKNYVENGEYI